MGLRRRLVQQIRGRKGYQSPDGAGMSRQIVPFSPRLGERQSEEGLGGGIAEDEQSLRLDEGGMMAGERGAAPGALGVESAVRRAEAGEGGEVDRLAASADRRQHPVEQAP